VWTSRTGRDRILSVSGHHDCAGHPPKNFGAAFAIGTALNFAFVIAQVVFGLFAHSLALIAVGAIALEALRRFKTPAPVAGTTVVWVAALGILVNGMTALLFMSGRTIAEATRDN